MSNYKSIQGQLSNLSPLDLLKLKGDIEIEWMSNLVGIDQLEKGYSDIRELIHLQNNKVRRNQDTIQRHLSRIIKAIETVEEYRRNTIIQSSPQKDIINNLTALTESVQSLVVAIKNNTLLSHLNITEGSAWMNTSQVGKYLHCSYERVRQLRNEGRLGGMELKNLSGQGSRWVFPRASVDAYRKANIMEREL